MGHDEPIQIAKRFFHAYNTFDIECLKDIVTEDVLWEHRNRFKGQGSDDLISSIQKFSSKVPGRAFSDIKRWAINGDTIFVEHRWQGTPAIDVPDFGWEAGKPTGLDCLSILVLSQGKIVEWTDYA